MPDLIPNLLPRFHRTEDKTLLSQVKTERVPLPRGFWKLISIDAVAVLAALLASRFYSLYISQGGNLVWLGICLAVSCTTLFLGLIFGANWKHRLIVIVLTVAAILIPFLGIPPQFLMSSSAVLLVFFIWAEASARRINENSLDTRFALLSHSFLAKAVTGIALAAVLLYLPNWDGSKIFISEGSFDSLFQSTANFVSGITASATFGATINLNSSVAELAKSIAKSQLMGNSAFKAMPPDQQDIQIALVTKGIIDNAGSSLGIPFTAETSVAKLFYRYIVKTLEDWRKKFGESFTVIWAITAFLLLRSVGALFVWAEVLLAYLVYELFFVLHWVQAVGENRVKEIVHFT